MSAAPSGLLPDVVTDSSALRPDLLDFFYGFKQLIPDLDHHPDRGIGFSGLFHHGFKITSACLRQNLLGPARLAPGSRVDRFELVAKNISKLFPIGINGLGCPGGLGSPAGRIKPMGSGGTGLVILVFLFRQ